MSALARRLQHRGARGGLHVMLVDGLALIDKEVGRTEKRIVERFEQARARSPTVLFLDNLDALAAPRGRTTTETNVVGDRSLSTLLTEMDGVASDPQRVVVVVASAPSPAALDPAVCRPGRLDVHISLSNVDRACAAAHLRQQLLQFACRLLARGGDGTAPEETAASCCRVIGERVDALTAQRASMPAAHVAAIGREIMIAALSSACGDGAAHAAGQERTPHLSDEALSVILNDAFTAVM
ncbi:hypothetical protein STCU_11034 [Strigomonas culicis]|uniref:ATPase AAA-type core domain-containing protein n=1 Tax=Strigomonas culicis TaxID=28005 RepID=S9V1P9_9TRYP|nr:hypothetical protein STCU_11034 [Strigomonas culicis]|eukprot:EPY16725.1 hypothetical protein STCU_11034 [Strigomonas culicis]